MNTAKHVSKQGYYMIAAHYLSSALCFLICAILMLLASGEFQGHYFNPKILAITHLAALGWATLVIFGAAYQLIPVIFETELFSMKLSWLSFFLFIPGLALLVFSFWIFDPGILMQCGGSLIVVSASLFCLNLALTAKSAGRRAGIQQDFIVSSGIWLLSTAILGLLLVFNFSYAFLPKDHLQFLKLHAHMGMTGWFLLLIIGVSAKLIPMFIVSREQPEKLLSYSYYSINAGLILFLVDTYLYDLNEKTYFIALLILSGILVYLRYVYVCFKSRLKKRFDLPIVNTLISMALLVLALCMIPFIIQYHLSNNPAAIRFSSIYGMLIFIGWISALILGQAFKTFPFIVWVRKYEGLSGKQKTPLPADLFSDGLLRLQTISFAAFNVLFLMGLFSDKTALLPVAIIALVITALCYISNLTLVFVHRPRRLNQPADKKQS